MPTTSLWTRSWIYSADRPFGENLTSTSQAGNPGQAGSSETKAPPDADPTVEPDQTADQ